MDNIKEIRSVGLIQRLQETAWPCGAGAADLRTATISVGLTCLVSTALLTLFFVEDHLANGPFSLTIVAVCAVSLFLLLTDIALLFGAVNKISTCLVPWMALHSALQVFLILYFAIKFAALAGYRAVILASFAVVAYFILVVFLHYKQLVDASKEDGKASSRKKKSSNAVVLDMEAMNGNVVDDTFTAIASRDVSGAAAARTAGLDDSGEFAVPTSATGSKNFAFPNDSVDAGTLPEPVEVIEVTAKAKSTNPFLQDVIAEQKLKQDEHSSDDESRECLLPDQPASEVRNTSRSDLVVDIDNKFTPFKPKGAGKAGQDGAAADLPKIKVFLPKGDNDDDDDSDCSSSSSTQHKQ